MSSKRERLRPIGAAILRYFFRIYLALNILVCACIPGSRPRETISGLMGRWIETEYGLKKGVAYCLVPVVDLIYFRHHNHCRDIHRQEHQAYWSLYQ